MFPPALLLSRMFYNDIRLTENRIADIENDLDRNERKKLECVHLFNDKTYARNLTMVCFLTFAEIQHDIEVIETKLKKCEENKRDIETRIAKLRSYSHGLFVHQH